MSLRLYTAGGSATDNFFYNEDVAGFPTGGNIGGGSSGNSYAASVNGDGIDRSFFSVIIAGVERRVFILSDHPNLVIRAFVNDGLSTTYTEADAAHVPQNLANSPLGFSGYRFGACQSTVNINLLYVMFYRNLSGHPSSDIRLAVVTFDMSTLLWGSVVISNLPMRLPNPGTNNFNGALCMRYRPVDNAIIFVQGLKFKPVQNQWAPVYGRYFPLGAGFDATWTPCGNQVDDGVSCSNTGAVMDSNNNYHMYFWNNPFPNGIGTVETITHQVLHPNGTLSGLQVVLTRTRPTAAAVFGNMSPENVIQRADGRIVIPILINPANITHTSYLLVTAADGSDAPAYTSLNPFPLITTDASGIAVVEQSGVLTAVQCNGASFNRVSKSVEPFVAEILLGLVPTFAIAPALAPAAGIGPVSLPQHVLVTNVYSTFLPKPKTKCKPTKKEKCAEELARKYSGKVVAYEYS